jgi:glyoxylate/hydroxypyruvate reductase A
VRIVFSHDPLHLEHPVLNHPKIIVTPRLAAAIHAPTAAASIADNLRRLADGRPLMNVVDLARGD